MSHSGEGPAAEAIAAYVDRETFERIPDPVLAHAKTLLLDSVGVTVGATGVPIGERLVDFWAAQGGVGEATVPGLDGRLPALHAAHANGQLANLLNFDDTYIGRNGGHPGATVVPGALAVAEREDVDGRTLLEGLVAGYEVSIRIGEAIAPSPERGRQVLGMSTWQIFGATVPTAKLLGATVEETTNALGLAGVTAPIPNFRKLGLGEDGFHWLKNNQGWAAMGGVKSGLLADRGFVGNRTIFDGDSGFWRMAGSDRFDRELLLDGLGTRYETLDVSLKPYPSGKWVQPGLDAVRELTDDVGDVADIERIEVESFDEVLAETEYPDSPLDAPISIPYLVSVSLHGYDPGPEWLSPANIADERVRALADRVTVAADEEMTRRFDESGTLSARVTVVMADGTEHRATVVGPRGGTERPLPESEVDAKFLTLTEPVLGEGRARELRDRIRSIEDESSLRSVAGLLSG